LSGEEASGAGALSSHLFHISSTAACTRALLRPPTSVPASFADSRSGSFLTCLLDGDDDDHPAAQSLYDSGGVHSRISRACRRRWMDLVERAQLEIAMTMVDRD
jgi:hypothetical protein